MTFIEWIIEHYYNTSTAQADLAHDLAFDTYHGANTYQGLLVHLNNHGASDACLEVFETTWEQYANAPDRHQPTSLPPLPGLNQHPAPIIGGWQDSEHLGGFLDLTTDTQRELITWIRNQLWLGSQWDTTTRSSYALKHVFERHSGTYVTNPAFKDAMILCGFTPQNPGELNHRYCIHPLSPAFTPSSCIGYQRVLPKPQPAPRG